MRFARGLFVLLCIFHVWAVSVGWNSGLLQGNEFRQSQTALTTLFVQREHNFSLSYPTPVLGKPWSVPMEFPLYQWTVALFSSATGQPLIQSARAISAICFYLCLPAIWMLLGHLRLSETQRWVALGAVLTCPLYIFYSRAFLIETMALLFSLWFLQGFVAGITQRSWFWVGLANVAGVGAGLVKVTTFMLYLAPAGICAAVWLWRAGAFSTSTPPAHRRNFWAELGWILSCVALPFLATLWWIKLADAIKSLNASGVQLVSSSMSPYHFGTWQIRRSVEPWLAHWQTLTTNLVPWPGLLVFLAISVWFGGRWKRWILGALLLFIAAPFTFPILYAWHEYYFVANGVILLAAVGLAMAGLIESSSPRWLVWTLVLGLHAIQIGGYVHYLYPTQRLPYPGGSGLTRLLRDMTDPQDVLLIAGNDWSSVIPFFSERRALMIRTHLENDPQYLDRAFNSLAEESVPVYIAVGDMRNNHALLDQICRRFAIDPAPFLTHKDQTVYVGKAWRNEYVERLFNLTYNDVVMVNPAERRSSDHPQPVDALRTTRLFVDMHPLPVRYRVPFGLSFGFRPDGRLVFDAHAPTSLWFHPPRPVRRVSLEFGITEEAYLRAGDRTDGVEFAVIARLPDGTNRTLFSRTLDPDRRVSDRAVQHADLSVSLPAGTEIEVATRPGPSGSNAFDWSFWQNIDLQE